MGGTNSKQSNNHDSDLSKGIKKEAKEIENVDAESKIGMYKGNHLGDAWPDSIRLPEVLEKLINQYHVNHYDVSRYTLDHCRHFTLFNRNATFAFYAFKIGTHVLNGKRTEALKLAQQYPESLTCVTQVKDPFNRLAEGMPLQLAAAAGNHLLVNDIRKLLNDNEAARQLNAQFPLGWEEEIKIRMDKQYLEPLRQFIKELTEIKLSPKGLKDFDQANAECKAIIDKYRRAIRPKPSDSIVTTSLIFDPQVYWQAYQIILSNINNLGGWNNVKTELIFAIGYQSLLGAASAFIAQIMIGGMNNYFDRHRKPPENLKFSDGSSFFSLDVCAGIGLSFGIDQYGDKYDIGGDGGGFGWGLMVLRQARWKSYVEQEHQFCRAYAEPRAFIDDVRSHIEFRRRNNR